MISQPSREVSSFITLQSGGGGVGRGSDTDLMQEFHKTIHTEHILSHRKTEDCAGLEELFSDVVRLVEIPFC